MRIRALMVLGLLVAPLAGVSYAQIPSCGAICDESTPCNTTCWSQFGGQITCGTFGGACGYGCTRNYGEKLPMMAGWYFVVEDIGGGNYECVQYIVNTYYMGDINNCPQSPPDDGPYCRLERWPMFVVNDPNYASCNSDWEPGGWASWGVGSCEEWGGGQLQAGAKGSDARAADASSLVAASSASSASSTSGATTSWRLQRLLTASDFTTEAKSEHAGSRD